MGILRYARKNLKNDIRKNLIYIFIIAFTFTFLMVIANSFVNDLSYQSERVDFYEGNISREDYDPELEFFNEMPNLLQGQFSIYLVIIVMIFTYLCNSYFMKKKFKESAFFTMNGATIMDLVKYIIYLNGTFFIISAFIGLLLGLIFIPLSNLLMNYIMGINNEIWTINFSIIPGTLLLYVFLFCVLTILNLGDIYRKEPVELLNARNTKTQADNRHIRIPNFVFIIAYLIPIFYGLIFGNTQGAEYGVYAASYLGLFGVYGIIKYFIPKLSIKINNMNFSYVGLRKIYIGNFIDTLRKSIFFFIIFVFSLIFFALQAIDFSEVPGANEYCSFAFVCVSFIVGLTLIYKLSVEWEEKADQYKQLKILGYNSSEISGVIKKENLLLFTIGFMIPILLLIVVLGVFIKANYFSVTFSIVLLLSAILPIFIIGVVTTMINKKRIIGSLFVGGNENE